MECLFYPAKRAKRLIITFAGAKKNLYSMWSWFWRDAEDWDDTAYLFLKDDTTSWYLGNNERSLVEIYTQIIQYFISLTGVSSDQVIAIGGSMGGYAAIFYAIACGLKAVIASCPQVTKSCAEATYGRFLVSNAEDQWVDLDEFIAVAEKAPYVSLNIGNDDRDKCAAFKLLDALKDRDSITVFHKGGKETHGVMFTPRFIELEVQYLENVEKLC